MRLRQLTVYCASLFGALVFSPPPLSPTWKPREPPLTWV
jgi:hypothetical protein